MKWNECKKRRIVKKTSVDKNMVSSLIEISNNRLITDDFAPLNDITASTKVASNYDSLREVLEALAISRGFKIYNHDCFVGFIQEFLDMDMEASRFDKFRKISNSVNYGGRSILAVDAGEIIKEILALRVKFLRILDE